MYYVVGILNIVYINISDEEPCSSMHQFNDNLVRLNPRKSFLSYIVAFTLGLREAFADTSLVIDNRIYRKDLKNGSSLTLSAWIIAAQFY